MFETHSSWLNEFDSNEEHFNFRTQPSLALGNVTTFSKVFGYNAYQSSNLN